MGKAIAALDGSATKAGSPPNGALRIANLALEDHRGVSSVNSCAMLWLKASMRRTIVHGPDGGGTQTGFPMFRFPIFLLSPWGRSRESIHPIPTKVNGGSNEG